MKSLLYPHLNKESLYFTPHFNSSSSTYRPLLHLLFTAAPKTEQHIEAVVQTHRTCCANLSTPVEFTAAPSHLIAMSQVVSSSSSLVPLCFSASPASSNHVIMTIIYLLVMSPCLSLSYYASHFNLCCLSIASVFSYS